MPYSNILEYFDDLGQKLEAERDARAVKQGYIDPNQFADHPEVDFIELEHGVDEFQPFEDALEDAKTIARLYCIPVKLEARCLDEETDMVWGEHEITVPAGGVQ